jgi:signal transduction histidine kinase
MSTFRASARTVDMLGRQQIAGIPTAISELFKNAHDAYATRVEADYLRWCDAFVLRDDGVGMSREDFENRWLTLGTDSKVNGASLNLPPKMPGRRARQLVGEKGIGRLAIASIGPQVLVLTRAYSSANNMPTVAALINWSLFEIPGVDLSRIPVPILETAAGLPTAEDVRLLVADLVASLEHLRPGLDESLEQRVRGQLEKFESLDAIGLDDELGAPSLREGSGTHFVIAPTDEALLAATQEPNDRYRTSQIRRALVGFTNSLDDDRDEIATAFREHRTRDAFTELIGGDAFFSREEFASADHHIEGEFDEFGQFRGRVTVYGTTPVDHVVAWPEAGGRQTDCGPFSLQLAVVQGERRNSLLPADEWAELTRKLDKIGGLYVYRNGIRILPYGDSDYDWVDIEFRRTKSASYYFFSYRRIFGYVDIKSGRNDRLVEKAGREGFLENKAYRQLKDILGNFFVQIAADFFREGGSEANRFADVQEELDRKAKLRQRREQSARVRRAEFEQALATSGRAVAEGEIDNEAAAIIDQLRMQLSAAAQIGDPDEAAREFIAAERRARRALADIRERYRVAAPRGFGLPRALRRDFEAYRADWQRVEETTLVPAEEMIETTIGEAVDEHALSVTRRRRFEEAIEDAISEAQQTTRESLRATDTAFDEVRSRLQGIRGKVTAEMSQAVEEVKAQLAREDVAALTDEDFVERRANLEEAVIATAERERATLAAIADQLKGLHWGGVNGDASSIELTEAMEDELIALREQSDEDLELAQLGMAVGVINHEFDASIRAVRSNLRRLKSWADLNEPLLNVYRGLRTSFDHLDGYLTLFTPLQRRLYRETVTMTGAEIDDFLRDLFNQRLERHKIRLTATKAFRSHRITGYPSTFYPVFVNLVDNAIFWLADMPEPRTVRLDCDGDTMTVTDSGPGIPLRDRQAVFERGFTRRPSGQGLGLYIARAVLKREGYNLTLLPSESGARFAIRSDPRSTTVGPGR